MAVADRAGGAERKRAGEAGVGPGVIDEIENTQGLGEGDIAGVAPVEGPIDEGVEDA